MKYKLGKPFSSFDVCTNMNNTLLEQWGAALRDPVYLLILAGNVMLWLTVFV